MAEKIDIYLPAAVRKTMAGRCKKIASKCSNALPFSIQGTHDGLFTESAERTLKLTVKSAILSLIAVLGSGCTSLPTVSTTSALPDSADGPYEHVMVVVLFSKFDTRRYLEDEIVKDLKAAGVDATASTSLMTTKTPFTREFIVESMTDLGSDALLVTQLADLEASGKIIDMRPEATYNVRPTYYVNVFSVDLQEYIEPQDVRITQELSTSSDLYSFKNQTKVWSMVTHSKFKENVDHMRDYSIFVREADAISGAMIKDGVIAD